MCATLPCRANEISYLGLIATVSIWEISSLPGPPLVTSIKKFSHGSVLWGIQDNEEYGSYLYLEDR